MNEEEILNLIRTRMGIEIRRFDSSFISIALTLDGEEIAESQYYVPSYEIRSGGDY